MPMTSMHPPREPGFLHVKEHWTRFSHNKWGRVGKLICDCVQGRGGQPGNMEGVAVLLNVVGAFFAKVIANAFADWG